MNSYTVDVSEDCEVTVKADYATIEVSDTGDVLKFFVKELGKSDPELVAAYTTFQGFRKDSDD